MNIDNLRQLLSEARRHDAALHYCRTCGNRYYDDAKGDVHDRPASECRDGGCLAPEDHHPFVEGPLPDYEEAAIDRRNLVRGAADLLAAVEALETILAHFAPEHIDSVDGSTIGTNARAVLRRLRGEDR